MRFDEMVTALRHYHKAQDCNECAAGYVDEWCDKSACIFLDAAAAIEDLEGFLAEAERDRDEYRERLDKTAEQLAEMQEDLDYANAANTEPYGAFQENEELKVTIELMKPYMPDFFPDANKMVLPKMEAKE